MWRDPAQLLDMLTAARHVLHFTEQRMVTFHGEAGLPIATHLTVRRSERGRAFVEVQAPDVKESNHVLYDVVCTR